jgi:hypothetical protein
MMREPPREHEWLSWMLAAFAAAIILITIPFARTITDFVAERWGRAVFRDGVTMLVVIAAGAALLFGMRLKGLSRQNIFWLLLAATALAYFTLGVKASAEETLHFIEYGALGFLVFRALAHRTRDIGIYPAAVVLCAAVGLCDETLQWLTPERVFDLRDVAFNTAGAAISQLAIAKGFSPPYIGRRVQPGTVRRLCLYTGAFAAAVWLCLANTPALTARLVCRFPQLWYLLYKSSAMSEYGYQHDVPGVGTFFSRFRLDELQQLDRRRADAAAEILNAYYDPRRYGKFLRTYTPLTDPFLHEIRVHLFRRDHYLSVAPKYETNPEMRTYHYTVAWREHLFVKQFFPETLSRSLFRWRENVERAVEQKNNPSLPYVSDVSANLITSFSLRTVHFAGILTMVALFGVWLRSWKW